MNKDYIRWMPGEWVISGASKGMAGNWTSIEEVLQDTETQDLSKSLKQTIGKKPVDLVPLEFLEYPMGALQVGQTKGYTKGSWKKPNTLSVWIEAYKRHAIEFDKGGKGYNGDYVEKHPITGASIPANHLDAMLFNIGRIKYGLLRDLDLDDRDVGN